jgi:flavin-binding protein dodecin
VPAVSLIYLTGIFFSAIKYQHPFSSLKSYFFTIKFPFMSVVKVIEVMSNSTKSWEDAAQKAVEEASKSLHNIRSIYIKEQNAVVENGKIKEYRVTGKVSFELDNSK